MDVYAVDSDWTTDKVTWNNGPGNASVPNDDFIARNSYTNSEIISNHNVVNVDISSYVRKLTEKGEVPEKISFLLAITDSKLPGYNADNAGFDAFSKEGAKQAYADYQAGKLKLPENHPAMAEDTLAPKIVLSNVYETGHEAIEIETPAGVAPTLPESTKIQYSDGTSKTVAINWPTIKEELYQEEGEFDVRGQAVGVAMPITAHVKVTTEKIASFKELPELDRLMGTSRGELDMPTEVTAVLESGEEVVFQVISWDDDVSNYSPSSPPGEYSFPAGLEEKAGISNPKDLKVFQTVHTHPIPEEIVIADEQTPLEPGTTHEIPVEIKGEGKYEELDEWSSQLDFVLVKTAEPQGALPTVDQNGLVTIPETATPGTYEILVKSYILPTVSEVYTFKVAVNKENLAAAIEMAESLKKADYTPESWAAVATALSEAKQILNEAVTQVQVNQATDNLLAAIDGLVGKNTQEVNKKNLEKLLAEAQGKNEADYTADSWQAFQEVWAKAQEVYEDKQATKKEVNQVAKELREAIKSLELKQGGKPRNNNGNGNKNK